jgi:fatty acid desaturase
MDTASKKPLMKQADYAKKLRPLLPKAAFQANPDRIALVWINLTILLLGWGIASTLDQWTGYYGWLYLPFAVLMGNSVIILLFSIHDIMHSPLIKNPHLLQMTSLLALAPLWTPPTLWRVVHNRVHHNHTNSLTDPDRNYLYHQPNSWGKWVQNLIVPSSEVNRGLMVIGMMFAWGIHTFRNLTSILFFRSKTPLHVQTPIATTVKEQRAIAFELLTIAALHFAVLCYLQFDWRKLLLAYFLPIGLGYAGVIFYIYTNHMLCQMTDVNDPLVNSVSIRVPKFLDLLHLNFSYHTEHHIFPGLNSDYYPVVQQLLQTHYPDQKHYLLSAQEAWRLMLQTPRHYQDQTTFTTWSGDRSQPCPLSEPTKTQSSGYSQERQFLAD